MNPDFIFLKIFGMLMIVFSVYNLILLIAHSRNMHLILSVRNRKETVLLILSNLLTLFLGIFIILPMSVKAQIALIGISLIMINTLLFKIHKL